MTILDKNQLKICVGMYKFTSSKTFVNYYQDLSMHFLHVKGGIIINPSFVAFQIVYDIFLAD